MKTAGVYHLEPMRSLTSTYSPQVLCEWLRALGCPVVAEPKLDGVAASVRYVDGHLESVATRGDGLVGRDITRRCYALVPSESAERGVHEIRGEIVIPRARWGAGETRASVRNRVAHLVVCNDETALARAGAVFIAYDFAGDTDHIPVGFACPSYRDHPCDGIVFKVGSRSDRARLGATKRAPRWAIAYKGAVDELRGLHGLSGIPLPISLA